MLWFYIIQGATLGFSVAIAPGPLQAYLMSHAHRYGARRTLPLIIAPVLSDVPIIALVLLALTQLPEWLLRALQIGGGMVLLYLAWETFDTFRRHVHQPEPPTASQTGQSIIKAALMNAISPGPYVFWGTIAGPLFLRGLSLDPALGWLFLAAFGLALVAGLVVYILASSSTRHLSPQAAPLVNGAIVLVLIGFGVYQIWAGFFGPATVLAH